MAIAAPVRSPIGRRVRHIEWEERTAGRSEYARDVELPGMLIARVLRSPHPHARIVSLDASEASSAGGVAAVLTADDLPGVRYIHHGGPLADRPVLAKDVVRFVGEEVAAVAAETREQAEAALGLIRVRYRRLPAVTAVRDALDDGAPQLHDHAKGNVSLRIARSYGEADAKGRATATVSGRYRFGRQSHASMETSSVVASWDDRVRLLHLWVSTQAPYMIRKEVAHALGLSLEQVETHELAVGGGFGSKSKISEHEIIAAALSMKAKRPVRLVLDRAEEFAVTKCRHDFEIELETGADADGALTHRSARATVDNGAYNHSGPSVMGYGSLVTASQYRTRAVDVDFELVYTNKHPGGQFRGYGGAQAVFAIESQMDELADRLGMDPIDLRIRNANHAGDVTHAGWRIASSRLVECLEAARDAIGWDAKRAAGGSGRGVGVAAAIHVSGANVWEGAERSDAAIDVRSDGRALVRFGGADAGTWQKTVLAQVAAAELGIDVADVEVLTMETAETPLDMGAWSSRGTFMSGHAVRQVAAEAAAVLRRAAADELETDSEAVTLVEGEAVAPGGSLPVRAVIEAATGGDDVLRLERTFIADSEPVDPKSGIANISPTYSFAVHAVELEVDVDTGAVQLVDVVAAHDLGKAINPIGAESQIIGGVAMGLGAALGEELIYEGGRLVNPAYLSYALPRAADLPPIRPILVEGDDPKGPYGAKGVGEISLIPAPAAVANAVAHAIGVRVRDLPITPDKIMGALGRGEGRRRYRLWRRPDRWWIAGMRAAYPRGAQAVLHRWGTRAARRRESRPITRIERPHSANEAVSVLASSPTATAVGGGTDLLPAREQGLVDADTLVDVLTIDELRQVSETPDGDLELGAGARLAELLRDPALDSDHVLRETIAQIASPQVREMATVAGNLCQQNRCWFFRGGFECYKRGGPTCPCYAVLGDHRFYHAALGAHRCQAVTPSDLGTTLTALDASVTVLGPQGQRGLPMDRFYTGPGETALKAGELVTQVTVPASARRRVSRFEKVRLWEGDFAVVSACASLQLDARGIVRDARVVVGAIAPTPLRLPDVERDLVDSRPSRHQLDELSRSWTWRAHPLAGNEWKVDAAAGLVRRCLEACLDSVGAGATASHRAGA
jgi:CO/xanthine dehydrogenase Mo-binding subunit/CO/xanthine dehydrogenase FAD-binding subunit